MEKDIDNIIKDALQGIKSIVDTNTIIGNPIKVDNNVTLLPISKISVGFVAGGGEISSSKKYRNNLPFAGGSTSGLNVTPVGFVAVEMGKVNYYPVDVNTAVGDFVSMANNIVNKLINNEEVDNEK